MSVDPARTARLQRRWAGLHREARKAVITSGCLLGFVTATLMFDVGALTRIAGIACLAGAVLTAMRYHDLTLRERASRDAWRQHVETADLQAENIRLWSERGEGRP